MKNKILVLISLTLLVGIVVFNLNVVTDSNKQTANVSLTTIKALADSDCESSVVPSCCDDTEYYHEGKDAVNINYCYDECDRQCCKENACDNTGDGCNNINC